MAKESLTSNCDTELIQLPETAGTGHASTAHAVRMPDVHGEIDFITSGVVIATHVISQPCATNFPNLKSLGERICS